MSNNLKKSVRKNLKKLKTQKIISYSEKGVCSSQCAKLTDWDMKIARQHHTVSLLTQKIYRSWISKNTKNENSHNF